MLIRWFYYDYAVRYDDSLCYSIWIQPELNSIEELYVYTADFGYAADLDNKEQSFFG